MINIKRMLDTFLALVRIDSEWGEEAALARDVADRLAALDVSADIDGAGNVIATLAAAPPSQAPPVLFCAHLDTVKPGKGVVPQVTDGVVTSASDTILGADNNAAIAALLELAHSLHEDGTSHGPVELLFTTGEEIFCTGASALDFSRLESRLGYAFDSPAPIGHVVASGPGHVQTTAEFVGRAAHTGIEPEVGLSAIRAAADAITRMRLGPLGERTSANVGTIAGGTGRNVVPERCTLEGEARSCSAADLAAAVADMRAACENAAAEHGVTCTFTHTQTLQPYAHEADAPVVALARAAARRAGLPDEVTWTLVGSDVNVLNANGIPAVNLGAALTHSHTTRESQRVRDLADIAAHAEAIALEAGNR